MLDQYQEIHNLLDYLSNSNCSQVHFRKSENQFRVEGFFTSVITDCEHHSFCLDFSTKTMIEYGHDESYHNGDHYNCQTKILEWDHILTGYTNLLNRVQLLAEKEVMRKLQSDLVYTRMNEILSGKI
jgi:hypothetical protein